MVNKSVFIAMHYTLLKWVEGVVVGCLAIDQEISHNFQSTMFLL